jgi:hypothetical protein
MPGDLLATAFTRLELDTVTARAVMDAREFAGSMIRLVTYAATL